MLTLVNDKGAVTIANDVFTWLAGDAASRCFGVKGMAGPKKENGLVQLLQKNSMTKGVKIALTENGVAIELHIIVEHGINLSAVTSSIRSEVSYRVAQSTGVAVERVEIYIDSIV
ncbi:MAG: Asp23/Gls24 family envelope stress response protein [Clostridiales bacterium]|nr:Asp23/Gls24 family envelope stress response protein [Candidatus Apopatocola equi]MCQ2438764.1 Asp23/Gls24 family envelope stress response protein [Oscillospiraceae bacterium]